MDDYTAADFAAQLLDSGVIVMQYVGVAVTGGVALLFAFMGVRKGIAFFKSTGRHDEDGNWSGGGSSELDDYEKYKDGGVDQEYIDRYTWAENFGIGEDAAHDYAEGREVDVYDVNGERFYSTGK